MTDKCMKPEWNDRCCCNCQHQRVIFKHPWNSGSNQGSVSDVAGFGCACEGGNVIIFKDNFHGMCEMHEMKNFKDSDMSEKQDLFDGLMDFIGNKFYAEEISYSEVIGALTTLKTMYKAQWSAICNEMANEEECDCGCGCDVEQEDVPKLQ